MSGPPFSGSERNNKGAFHSEGKMNKAGSRGATRRKAAIPVVWGIFVAGFESIGAANLWRVTRVPEIKNHRQGIAGGFGGLS